MTFFLWWEYCMWSRSCHFHKETAIMEMWWKGWNMGRLKWDRKDWSWSAQKTSKNGYNKKLNINITKNIILGLTGSPLLKGAFLVKDDKLKTSPRNYFLLQGGIDCGETSPKSYSEKNQQTIPSKDVNMITRTSPVIVNGLKDEWFGYGLKPDAS